MLDRLDRYDSLEGDPAALVCRLPYEGTTGIAMGSHVVVDEGEIAALRVGDVVTDLIAPGTHVVDTRSVPITTRLLELPYASGTRFDGVFYFLRTGSAVNVPWGTPTPVIFQDNMFGETRVRAHGEVRVRVTNPRLFLAAWGDEASRGELSRTLSYLVASRLTDALAKRVDTLIDLERYREELGRMVGDRIEKDLDVRGLTLDVFGVTAMTLPPKVMSMIESRAAVGSVRQLREFLRLEATHALVEISRGSRETPTAREEDEESDAEELAFRCGGCHATRPDDSEFCSRCGAARDSLRRCLLCGGDNSLDATFCQSCGAHTDVKLECPECSTPAPPSAHFCLMCGHSLSRRKAA